MENERLETVAELVWSSLEIPACCLRQREIYRSFPDSSHCFLPPRSIIDAVIAHDGLIFHASFGASYVKIMSGQEDQEMLLLGPVTSVPYDLPALTRILREYNIPNEKWSEATKFFRLIPTVTPILLAHRIRLILYALCGVCVPFREIIEQDMAQRDADVQQPARVSDNRMLVPNNSYEIENALLDYVSNGDAKGLEQFIGQLPNFYPGIIAPDVLRNFKNYFITICSLAARTAIRAGLSTGTAFEMSDRYILIMESLTNQEQVNQLYNEMLMEFAKQVAGHKDFLKIGTLEGLPLPVRSAILYVQAHVYDELDVGIVADSLGYSRSYLSKVFSASMGFCLKDFIFRCKLEESKVLLAYSRKKLSEIATYLGFSSQSHFQKRFKETFHMTPNEYRAKNSSAGELQIPGD